MNSYLPHKRRQEQEDWDADDEDVQVVYAPDDARRALLAGKPKHTPTQVRKLEYDTSMALCL